MLVFVVSLICTIALILFGAHSIAGAISNYEKGDHVGFGIDLLIVLMVVTALVRITWLIGG